MSIFEKIDTERHRRDINLCKPVRQPDASGLSGVEPGAIEPIPSAFNEDCSARRAIPNKSMIPTLVIGTQGAAVSKGPQG